MKVGSGKSEAGRKAKAGGRARGGAARTSDFRLPTSDFRLGANNYGKSRVRMVKVSRKGRVHTVREIDVAISLEGDFEAIHCAGDNAHCLPTDTMKNTVYALGKDHPLETIEEFALHLARHFVTNNPQVSAARVQIRAVPWKRVKGKKGEHPHCFIKGSDERQTCDVVVDRNTESVESGLEGLVILKSTDSAFSGYPKDKYTTLAETRDRVFCTSVSAHWEYDELGGRAGRGGGKKKMDYAREREAVRRALIEAFAGHKSESVQQTLYEMGKAALKASRAAESIRLSMPNKHCLLVNLKPFGLTNEDEIFVPTDEPHGLIEGTVERG